MIYKVMAIDDDPNILDLVTSILDDEEIFAVRSAWDGNQALQMCLMRPPHLILLDLTLPGRDGFSVLRLLKRDRRTANSKVIILTGQDNEAARSSAGKLGADAFMTKPFSPIDLLNQISQLLNVPVPV